MKTLDTFFNVLMDVCIFVAKILLLAMTSLICVSVFYRYVLNRGIKWSDEVSMLLMVWFGFISIAYGVKQHLHLSVEVFFNMFPPRLRRILNKCTTAIVCLLGIMMTIYGALLMQSTAHNVMTATRWPSATLYAVVPVSGLLIAYFAFSDVVAYQSTYKKVWRRGGRT